MATLRQILANRRNAKLSTGPRTAAGKARSSLNGFCHGLHASLGQQTVQEVEELTKVLVAEYGEESIVAARDAAQAEIDLRRVHEVRQRILDRSPLEDPSRHDEIPDWIAELARLDRYERSARFRQRKALRAIPLKCLG